MKKTILLLFLISSLFLKAELVTYSRPCTSDNSHCISASPRYSVEVRKPGGEWIPSFTYHSPGHTPDRNATPDASKSDSWTSFSFSGSVEVKVKLLSGTANRCIVRPKSRNISATLLSSENAVVFTVDQPGQFSVEFNGVHKHSMLVFANPHETNIPTKSSSKLHYFGPGVHDIGLLYGDVARWTDPKNRVINEGDTIYIAGGAYVYGTISCTVWDNNYQRTKNVTIMGRGVLSGALFTRLSHPDFESKAHIYSLIRLGANSKIDGITLTNAPGYSITTSDNCHINNVKVLAWYWSTDAYANGDNCITENSFSKVEDDHNKSESPRQIIRNNVYFLQSNGSVLITGYNTSKGTIEFGAKVSNCDVLHADDLYDDAVIQSVYGGGQTLSNYTFEDIRIEGNCTRLFGMAVCNNAWAPQDKLYGRLMNITFKNITLEGKSNMAGYLWGATSTDYVSNVIFENVSVGGKMVTNSQEANIGVGPYVHNVYFKIDGNTVGHEKGFFLDPNRVALLTPSADCPVHEKSPNENFGVHRNSSVPNYWLSNYLTIRNKSGERNEAFIRFENIPEPDKYVKAYLCLWGNRDWNQKATIEYTLVNDDNWSENALTWNTSRSLSTSPISVTQKFDYGLNIIDVTEIAKTQFDRKLSLKISEFSNGIFSEFHTREALTPFMFFSKSDISSIGDPIMKDKAVLYPNPVGDFFRIKNDTNDNLFISIRDINGRLIKTLKVFTDELIDVKDLPKGLYTIEMVSSDQKNNFSQTFIKL